MKIDEKKKNMLQYVPGAAYDGMGYFPAITCQIEGQPPEVLWIVFQKRRQVPEKDVALSAANSEIALAFQDRKLPGSPERFLAHLRQRGFSDMGEVRVAKSFDDDRRTALGDEYQPVFGEAAARHDPVMHAALMQMVDRRIADNDPPETRETIERLLEEGYSPEYIRRMIGLLIARELMEEMFHHTPFNTERFVGNLLRLPEVPDL